MGGIQLVGYLSFSKKKDVRFSREEMIVNMVKVGMKPTYITKRERKLRN